MVFPITEQLEPQRRKERLRREAEAAYQKRLTEYKKQKAIQEAAIAKQKVAKEAYQRELAAYEYAKYALRRNLPPGGGPVGTYKWYKKLWSAGYGQTGVYAKQVGPKPGEYYPGMEPGTYTPPDFVKPEAPKPEPTYPAYKHILTGEMISAIKSPGPLYEKVRVTPKGELIGREIFPGVVAPIEAPKAPTIEKVRAGLIVTPAETGWLAEQRAKLRTGYLRDEIGLKPALGGIGVGALISLKGTYEFHRALITKPITTIKAIPAGIGLTIQRLPEVSRIIRQEPFFTTGFVGAEVGQAIGIGYGISKIPKGVGFVRTIGKRRRAPEKIIQKEVLLGRQTFPIAPIKYHYKLFKEAPYKLAGEKGLTGVWKAVPSPWAKEARTLIGGYELPGAYVAPSLSPYFLRIPKGKYKLFGLGELGIFKRPTALRIYVKGIKKGIKGRPGIAELPLTSREIQAVIPPGTLLTRIGIEDYSKWAGVRFPIHKYKVAGLKEVKLGKAITAEKLFRKYPSPYYVKPSPLITPYSLGVSLGKLTRAPSYPYKRLAPVYKIARPSKVYKITPSRRIFIPPYAPAARYVRPYPLMKKIITPRPPYYPIKPIRTLLAPPTKRIFDILERKRRKIPKGFRRIPQPQAYTPSLVAAILRIRARRKPYVIPKKFRYGFFPGVRPIIIKKKRRKKKRK